MEWIIKHIAETDSTNRWLKTHKEEHSLLQDTESNTLRLNNNFCLVADYQTDGRGCGNNHWEAERGKNLLFSLLIHPEHITANRQFHISKVVSIAICEALGQHIADLSIKWPNDIYWRNDKICGILIENTLKGHFIKDCIIGVGLNVNQRQFHSDAPNPVSLWQIIHQDTDREELLHSILNAFDKYMAEDVKAKYLQKLYRRKDFHHYADKDGTFMAELVTVEDDGHLLLRDDNNQQRRYAFKEVKFI